MSINKPFLTRLFEKLTAQIGPEIIIEEEYGYTGAVTFKNDKRIFFRGSNVGINLTGAAEIAKD